jgi:RHS repeat-associated protein
VNQQGETTWQGIYEAFGHVLLNSSNQITMNLRLPGQYFDAETSRHYNYFRDYNPQIGRYHQRDPIGISSDLNVYNYSSMNPLQIYDPFGLFSWSDAGDAAVDFLGGAADTMTFGAATRVLDYFGINPVNRCSGWYTAGEWAGVVGSIFTGGAAGLRVATKKAAGLEYSHWIPARVLRNRFGMTKKQAKKHNPWNGNYVTPERHYKHDPYRYPRGWKTMGDRLDGLEKHLDRIPTSVKGAGLYGGASAGAIPTHAGDECGCQ